MTQNAHPYLVTHCVACVVAGVGAGLVLFMNFRLSSIRRRFCVAPAVGRLLQKKKDEQLSIEHQHPRRSTTQWCTPSSRSPDASSAPIQRVRFVITVKQARPPRGS
jgi:hypothetical protein